MISARTHSPHRVGIVVFDDAEPLDLAGPAGAFEQTNLVLGTEVYRIEILARSAAVRLSAGVSINATPLNRSTKGYDTLLVVGGVGFDVASSDRALVGQFASLALTSGRVGSVCTGAFVLAATGMLDGRRATTHWSVAELLAQRYPRLLVEADAIYTEDGGVWTSAGVSAGVDLTLAMIAADHGGAVAHEVARWMVLPVRRSGGQSQYGPLLASGDSTWSTLGELCRWIVANPAADLSTAALSRRSGWSERHLSRKFLAETGKTPAQFVRHVRLDAVRRLLETTDLSLDAIAAATGFATREVLYRTFYRVFSTSPGQYRSQFGRT